MSMDGGRIGSVGIRGEVRLAAGSKRAVVGSQFVHLIHRPAQPANFVAKSQHLRSFLTCETRGFGIGQLLPQLLVGGREFGELPGFIAEHAARFLQANISAPRDSDRSHDAADKDAREYKSFHDSDIYFAAWT